MSGDKVVEKLCGFLVLNALEFIGVCDIEHKLALTKVNF